MDLRQQIRAALEAAAAICEKAATEKRGLSPEELAAIDVHEQRAKTLKAQLETENRAAELRREADSFAATAPPTQAGQRADPPASTDQPEIMPWTSEERKYQVGDALGALVAMRCRFGSNHDEAVKEARKLYGERSPQMRAMTASNFTAGGATIGENFVGSELIELLRAKAAVRRAGARSIQLVGGTATLPKVTGGSSAYWGDEGDNITASEMTTGNVKLAEKKLTALVPFSNDLFRNSSITNDRLIRDDMVASAANAEDIAFLKGPGTSSQPKGIYYWVGAAGRGNSAGTALANIRTDVRTAKNRLGNNNAPDNKRAWFMHSRGLTYLGTEVVDANSNLVWPALAVGDGAPWQGGTVYQDNNVSIVLGSGDKSEIYYAEMSECFIGDSLELDIEVFKNAAYVDATGNLRSGVSRDESVLRLIRKVDFAMRHVESAYVLESVSYGA